jgi:hypothetical protein
MNFAAANEVVEELRRSTELYLPALTKRRGFSSSRVEHLLNRLVAVMPQNEMYLEIGTLEGRTLEAAACGNKEKILMGVDPCEKYDTVPEGFPENVRFVKERWEQVAKLGFPRPIGCIFYDGDHSISATRDFMYEIMPHLADEAVLVMDDWDRESVRAGAFAGANLAQGAWRLLREMPEYTGGLNGPPHHFGYAFGVSVWGFKR